MVSGQRRSVARGRSNHGPSTRVRSRSLDRGGFCSAALSELLPEGRQCTSTPGDSVSGLPVARIQERPSPEQRAASFWGPGSDGRRQRQAQARQEGLPEVFDGLLIRLPHDEPNSRPSPALVVGQFSQDRCNRAGREGDVRPALAEVPVGDRAYGPRARDPVMEPIPYLAHSVASLAGVVPSAQGREASEAAPPRTGVRRARPRFLRMCSTS